MKIGELLELLDEAIAELKIAIISNQQRVFESPYTSYEFAQRAIELQEDLDDLVKVREKLSSLDPEEEAEKYFSKDELEKFLKLLELLRKSKSHVY